MRKIPYTARTYRAPCLRDDEASFQVLLDESDLWITCCRSCFDNCPTLPARVMEKLRETRGAIRAWMRLQPEFGPSLVPLAVPASAPAIVKNMAQAADRWQVGPMAAVAGAVAEEITRAFMDESPDFIVENGGDIFMASTRERTVALLPEPQNGAGLGIKISAPLFPISVCSSSSTIGHSLSFGGGELVTVLCRDAALADAAATSLCNRLKTPRDLKIIVQAAKNDPDVLGLFAQCAGKMALWGDLELVAITDKN